MKLMIPKMIITVFVVFLFFILLEVFIEVNFPVVKKVSVTTASDQLKGELKIVQISDVHSKLVKDGVLKKIKEFNPDLIAITGDVVNKTEQELESVSLLADNLSKIGAPVYFVTGNHDSLPMARKEKIIDLLKDKGVVVLNNKSVFTGKINADIIGINDWNTDRPNLEKAFADVSPDSFKILLSHNPVVYYHLGDRVPDLILSGHTHGGQISVPILGALALPDGEADEMNFLIKGLKPLEVGDGWIYTDSGYGTSSLPIRFMNRSQVSFITISK